MASRRGGDTRSTGSSDFRRLRVAWIADPKKFGTKPGYPKPNLRDRLQREAGWSFVRLTPREVKKGSLTNRDYDIFIVPGGYAPNFAEALGHEGGENIRRFVQAGGGYVGICAGAYLGTSWGYDLLPVNVLDINHWDRGKTLKCQLKTTARGLQISPKLPKDFEIPYVNGPLFEILDSSVESLVDFESQLCGKDGTYPQVMRGSPAILAGPFGKGRVVLLSPHMEGAVPLAGAFRSLVAWTADAGGAARPVSPMVAPVKGKPTEASITQIFQKFDANQDGKLDINELQNLLTSLVSGTETLPAADVEGLLKSIKEKDSESGSGIRYEEFIAWIFGAPCFQDPDVGSDGETDAIMDPPSLIRMSSDAQYGEGVKVPENEKDPSAAATPSLTRTCSSCGGNTSQLVSPERLEASVVCIQRATRRSRGEATAKEVTVMEAAKAKAKAEPKAKAVGKAKAKAIPTPSPGLGDVILKKGGVDLICCLGGPILLSAPHSMKLMRGGGDTGEKSRMHKRERYTAEIAMIVAKELHLAGTPASVLVWNRICGPGRDRMDPNYLLRSQFSKSKWHKALHHWATKIGKGGPATDAGVPLFHVDLHGKVSEQLHLDLGAAPLEAVWPEDQSFVRALKFNFCKKLDQVMADCRVLTKGKQIMVDSDPRLHGFWGADTVTTISHQSVLLGIPAVQFEMPPQLREQLILNPELGQRFARAIQEVYHEVVTPWWKERMKSTTPWPRHDVINPTAEVEETLLCGGLDNFPAWSTQMVDEFLQIEKSMRSEDQI